MPHREHHRRCASLLHPQQIARPPNFRGPAWPIAPPKSGSTMHFCCLDIGRKRSRKHRGLSWRLPTSPSLQCYCPPSASADQHWPAYRQRLKGNLDPDLVISVTPPNCPLLTANTALMNAPFHFGWSGVWYRYLPLLQTAAQQIFLQSRLNHPRDCATHARILQQREPQAVRRYRSPQHVRFGWRRRIAAAPLPRAILRPAFPSNFCCAH